MGLGTRTPVFSWTVRAADPDDELVGARIQVDRVPLDPDSDEVDLADLWDSGDLRSVGNSIEYAGAPLTSRDEFWWRVRLVGADGPGPWTERARAELGLLERPDWSAAWITHPAWTEPEPPEACPALTTTFTLTADVRRARLYVTGLGVYVVDIDGIAVDDAVLEPGSSDFAVRVTARTVDVAHLLTAGEHRITVRLGEGSAHVRESVGRYTKFVGRRRIPAALVQLEVEYADGVSERVVSDRTWQATLGATRLAHWYGGEVCDARLDPSIRTADARWVPVAVVETASTGPEPWWRHAPPVRLQETLDPISLRTVAADDRHATVVADFGVNFAGRPTIALDWRVAAGTVLTLWPAERIDADGRADQTSSGSPVFDSYVARGGGESWHPEFCYHGFRYLQINGPAELVTMPSAFTFRAEVLRTDDAAAGLFASDDLRLDKLYALIQRAIESNLFSMPTDCPHREKLGWLEQLHLVFGPLSHAFDIHAHFRDVVTNIVDAQTEDGLIPDIAPELVVFGGGFRSDVNWGAAVLEIPWRLYATYGDPRPLAAAWDVGVRYLDYLAREAGDGSLDHGLGDWKTLDDSTLRALVAGHGHVQLLDTAARIAEILGFAEAADTYVRDAARRRSALARAFVDPKSGICGSGSQSSYALALDLGIVADELRPRALDHLVGGIESTAFAVTVGEIALPALLRVLATAGRHDTIHRMVTQTAAPGYGRMLEDGSTALAEAWDDPGDSANHFMFGAVGDWLVGDVAGLRRATGSIGWDGVHIAPCLLEGLTGASASYRSRHGVTSVDWTRTETTVSVTVVVPVGCEASRSYRGSRVSRSQLARTTSWPTSGPAVSPSPCPTAPGPSRSSRRARVAIACIPAPVAPKWRHDQHSDQGRAGQDSCHPSSSCCDGSSVPSGVPARSPCRGGRNSDSRRGPRSCWRSCWRLDFFRRSHRGGAQRP